MAKIGVAVLGLGNMGCGHVQAALSSLHVNMVAGYEPDETAGFIRAKELGIAVTSDLDSILNNDELQLVTIATPNEFHAALSIKSLMAGKAVFCEKPMGANITQCREVLNIQRKTGGFLTYNFEARCSRMYEQVKQWIVSGCIGNVLNTHCDYWCSEFHHRDSWRSNSSVTLIGEKLCHYLDLPRWWIEDEVLEIYSLAAPNFVKYFNHPDNHTIVYRFKNGAISSLNFIMGSAETFKGDPLLDMVSQQADDGHRLTYIIYGTKGAIEADVFRRRIRRWQFSDGDNGLESEIVESLTFEKAQDLEYFHNMEGHIRTVCQRVATGQKPLIDPNDSFESMKMVFAAEISEAEKRPIKLAEL